MPRRLNLRRFTIAILAVWNLLAGFGFYGYVIYCYVHYPPNHERLKFRYHVFHGQINEDVVGGLTVVMLSLKLSSFLLSIAKDETRRNALLFGVVFSMPFTFASLPAWPLAVIHTSLNLIVLSYYFVKPIE